LLNGNDKTIGGVFDTLRLETRAMVRQPTKYSKRHDAIQEAYFAGKHLRESRGKAQFMDAQNKWSRARKVIEVSDSVRVSSRAVGNLPKRNVLCAAMRKEIGGRVNALAAISRGNIKRTLNAVVEVKYTTARLEVAGCM
jgi:hypothetical protein